MSEPEKVLSTANQEQKIAELKVKSAALEQRMSVLLKSLDGNSNYRNDIIWLAGEINTLQKQIKELETGADRV